MTHARWVMAFSCCPIRDVFEHCTKPEPFTASCGPATVPLTTFDAPGAGTIFGDGTVPLGINPAGVILGYYNDANSVQHGLLLKTRH